MNKKRTKQKVDQFEKSDKRSNGPCSVSVIPTELSTYHGTFVVALAITVR